MPFTGIALILLGVVAFFSPMTTGVTIEVFLGLLLAAAGVLHLLDNYRTEAIRRRWGGWGVAAVLLVAGLLLLFLPKLGLGLFTLFLGAVFILQGGIMLFSAFSGAALHRRLYIAAGIVGLIAGVLILANWPASGRWLIGTLVGLNLMVLGGLMVMRRVDKRPYIDA